MHICVPTWIILGVAIDSAEAVIICVLFSSYSIRDGEAGVLPLGDLRLSDPVETGVTTDGTLGGC